ncbi:MAG: Rieske 2Fe-2S domain-containing protein [Planctomycetota bacterium]|nr:Rieske 2Fe-2S domain-containing protein [Planctomycetota bacterium]
MADKDLTVEEILLRCREMDGEGGSAPAPEEDAAVEDAAVEAATEEVVAEPASIDPSNMSVADMLAAARASASGEEGAAEEVPAEPSSIDPSKMSVADMLAAARTSASGESAAAPKAAAKPKPGASKVSATAASKKEESVAQTGPRETASVLAAARKGAQRGPQRVEDAVKTAEEGVAKPSRKPPIELPPAPRREDFLPPKPAPVVADATDRRSFFGSTVGVLFGAPLAVGFTSMAITSLLWLLGLARFMFPNVLTEPPTKFKVGFPDAYAPGQVEAKYKAQFGVWIVRYEYEGEAQIYALKSVCTHLGCTPNWLEGEQKFKCPCHGSGFYKDGVNFEGPAPRPLERYAIRLSDDGQLEVDKSTKFNEELGQWADSSSYVSV